MLALGIACGDDDGGTTGSSGSGASASATAAATTGTGGAGVSCDPPEPLHGSCVFTNDGLTLCNSFHGELDEETTVESLEDSCVNDAGTEMDGVWSTDPCSTDMLAGLCLAEGTGTVVQLTHFYPGGSYQPGIAEAICQALDDSGFTTTFCAP
jgi:hypothetical protein